jgi:hypothetical protein
MALAQKRLVPARTFNRAAKLFSSTIEDEHVIARLQTQDVA